ncbi:hypothetical protein B9Z19DRAFT_843757 [Tuber borchii]|uniref:Secreted protein n=1 Tax=Tuber borchii TaxID=42251 RepID=A0A2T6ZUR5_TUBBO|nr:hypothetical protein B9Z19DRAFT_843757 [Tuber borchii]
MLEYGTLLLVASLLSLSYHGGRVGSVAVATVRLLEKILFPCHSQPLSLFLLRSAQHPQNLVRSLTPHQINFSEKFSLLTSQPRKLPSPPLTTAHYFTAQHIFYHTFYRYLIPLTYSPPSR